MHQTSFYSLLCFECKKFGQFTKAARGREFRTGYLSETVVHGRCTPATAMRASARAAVGKVCSSRAAAWGRKHRTVPCSCLEIQVTGREHRTGYLPGQFAAAACRQLLHKQRNLDACGPDVIFEDTSFCASGVPVQLFVHSGHGPRASARVGSFTAAVGQQHGDAINCKASIAPWTFGRDYGRISGIHRSLWQKFSGCSRIHPAASPIHCLRDAISWTYHGPYQGLIGFYRRIKSAVEIQRPRGHGPAPRGRT